MANKPLGILCAGLNSTGHIEKCEKLVSSLTADFLTSV